MISAMNTELSTILEGIKENIWKCCKNKPVGVLCTGGLDSSLIAYLTQKLKPVLYFGAVIDPSTKEYNLYSIQKCKIVAKTLGLKLRAIPLTKKDYLISFPKVIDLLDEPPNDPDLPAVYTLYRKIKALDKPSILLSGIGVNEIFGFSVKEFKEYIGHHIPVVTDGHKKIAAQFGMDFRTPFLNQKLTTYALKTPLKIRKNKTPLKKTLHALKMLPPEIIDQSSRHSGIPENFKKIAKILHSHQITI